MATQQKKQPFAEALRRRNIQGSLWQNHDGNGKPFYVASTTRSYKDAQGSWVNETLNVPLDDIPKVIAVLREMETTGYEAMQADYQAGRNQQGAA